MTRTGTGRTCTRLAQVMAERKLTSAALACESGCSHSTIDELRLGWRNPKPANAHKIADALGLAVEQVFETVYVRTDARLGRYPLTSVRRFIGDCLDWPATGDPDWQQQSACVRLDLDYSEAIFFADLNAPGGIADTQDALALCMTCPVLGDCREEFMGLPLFLHRYERRVGGGTLGVWFGTTAPQRRRAGAYPGDPWVKGAKAS